MCIEDLIELLIKFTFRMKMSSYGADTST